MLISWWSFLSRPTERKSVCKARKVMEKVSTFFESAKQEITICSALHIAETYTRYPLTISLTHTDFALAHWVPIFQTTVELARDLTLGGCQIGKMGLGMSLSRTSQLRNRQNNIANHFYATGNIYSTLTVSEAELVVS